MVPLCRSARARPLFKVPKGRYLQDSSIFRTMDPVFSTMYIVSCVGPKSGSLQYQIGYSTAGPLLVIEELQTDERVVTDTSAVTEANLLFCDEPSRLAKILARLYVYASRQQLHGAAGALPGCSCLSLSVSYCQHVPSSGLLWCCVLLHFLQLSTSSSWIPGIGDMPNCLVIVLW